MPEADQQHGTGEIDEQCAGASRREWQRRRGDGQGELLPGHPESGETRNQDEGRQHFGDGASMGRGPSHREEDQGIEGRILQKVD